MIDKELINILLETINNNKSETGKEYFNLSDFLFDMYKLNKYSDLAYKLTTEDIINYCNRKKKITCNLKDFYNTYKDKNTSYNITLHTQPQSTEKSIGYKLFSNNKSKHCIYYYNDNGATEELTLTSYENDINRIEELAKISNSGITKNGDIYTFEYSLPTELFINRYNEYETQIGELFDVLVAKTRGELEKYLKTYLYKRLLEQYRTRGINEEIKITKKDVDYYAKKIIYSITDNFDSLSTFSNSLVDEEITIDFDKFIIKKDRQGQEEGYSEAYIETTLDKMPYQFQKFKLKNISQETDIINLTEPEPTRGIGKIEDNSYLIYYITPIIKNFTSGVDEYSKKFLKQKRRDIKVNKITIDEEKTVKLYITIDIVIETESDVNLGSGYLHYYCYDKSFETNNYYDLRNLGEEINLMDDRVFVIKGSISESNNMVLRDGNIYISKNNGNLQIIVEDANEVISKDGNYYTKKYFNYDHTSKPIESFVKK